MTPATHHTAYGSVEGTLTFVFPNLPTPNHYVMSYNALGIKVIHPPHILLVIYDDVTERHTPCYLPAAKYTDKALCAINKRVIVSGVLYYDEEGKLVCVNGEFMEVFPDPDTLPDFDDVRGLFR